MTKKIDKAAGVKVASAAKIGKEVKPPKKFSASTESIQDMVMAEITLLRETIAELEGTVVRLSSKSRELESDLQLADGRNINYIRKIDQVLKKNDLLKDDIIAITKSFCLIK
jgi:predicted nuclease with TOPRIM domain